MAGLLSSIFESAGDNSAGEQMSELGADARDGMDEMDGGSVDEVGNRTESASDTDVDASASFRVDVSFHAEGSYRDADGDQTEWSRDTHLSTGRTEVGTSVVTSNLSEADFDSM